MRDQSLNNNYAKSNKGNAIVSFINASIIFLIFICIGSYLSILSLILFLIIFGCLYLTEIDKRIIGAPYSILLLFFIAYDINNGPLWGDDSYLAVSLSLSALIVFALHKFVMIFVQKTIKCGYFTICPRCYYFNREMVTCCRNCSFCLSDEDNTKYNLSNNDVYDISSFILGISKEDICYVKKTPLLDLFGYLNNRYYRFTHFIIEKNNLLLLEIGFLWPMNWRKCHIFLINEIDDIRINDISSSNVKKLSLEVNSKNQDHFMLTLYDNNDNKEFLNKLATHVSPIAKVVWESKDNKRGDQTNHGEGC